jgi:hypothetical protein
MVNPLKESVTLKIFIPGGMNPVDFRRLTSPEETKGGVDETKSQGGDCKRIENPFVPMRTNSPHPSVLNH